MLEVAAHSEYVEPRQYRTLREGPEAELQIALQERLDDIFPQHDKPVWTAGSVPLGAGIPDIVRTVYEPELAALSDADATTLAILAYLRSVGRARPETICGKLGKGLQAVERRLTFLLDAEIACKTRGAYSLAESWRGVLPEVWTIEVKVSDWRRALSQAARNRIFSNKSFVAMPENVASRIRNEPVFRELGIGLISVRPDRSVKVLRKARWANTKAWTYYYSLASLAAVDIAGTKSVISN